jgi:hypothetical protein
MIKNIVGKPVPINYCQNLLNDRWCIVNVIDGKFKGEQVCLIATFQDKSVVDLGSSSPYYESDEDFTLVTIPNQYLDFDLEKHLETNRLLEEMNKEFITKDSGERLNFESGMKRDIETNKPRFDLLMALDDNYETCLLTRWANLLARGAEKYSERNWEQANSLEEFKRFKSSAYRHFVQAMMGEDDEDHFAAVLFNLNGMVYLMNKLGIDSMGNLIKENKNEKTNQ